jgi:hypothetical protein
MKKKCSKCNRNKLLENFTLRLNRKEGTRSSWCKDCQKKAGRIRREAKKEKGLCQQGSCPIKTKKGYTVCSKHIKLNKELKIKLKNERINKGVCINGCVDNIVSLRYCQKCLDKYKQANRQIKIDTLNAYGGCQCACIGCGITQVEFLTLDHIKGNGASHRNEVGKGAHIYWWLKKKDYPIGYQVLCYNCNAAKGTKEECSVHGHI